jgi:hypothetical protein
VVWIGWIFLEGDVQIRIFDYRSIF